MAPSGTTILASDVTDGCPSPPFAKLCFQPKAAAASPGMVRSNQDMKRFRAEMAGSASKSKNRSGDGEDGDFLFIEGTDGDTAAEKGEKRDFLQSPSPSPDSVADTPTVAAAGTATAKPPGGMRRVMSAASLTTRANRAGKSGPSSSLKIHTIQEHDRSTAKPSGGMRRVMSAASLTTRANRAGKSGLSSSLKIHTIQEHDRHRWESLGASARHSDSDDGSLNHSVHSMSWVRKGSAGRESTPADIYVSESHRRPPRGLGALRGSLKSSSNSLRRLGSSGSLRKLGSRHKSGNSLFSSGSSFVSAASELSGFDDTNHSLPSDSSDDWEDDLDATEKRGADDDEAVRAASRRGQGEVLDP